MKNKYCLLSLLVALLSNSANAIDVMLKPFDSTTATVSSKEPNVINVKNDTIAAINSKNGAIINDAITTDGSVIFSTSETKPFSILVETEKGFTFTVNAAPNKNHGSASIIIHNLAEKGNLDSNELSNISENTYSGFISKLLTEVINERVPNGFVETRNRSFNVSPDFKGILKTQNLEALVGQNIRIVKLAITNVSNNEIELNERILWNKNVMAISFYPSVSKLQPNYRVFAYVLLKEVE